MRECRTYGSVRGVRSNAHSYRNSFHTSPLDRGSIGCSFFHGGIGTPLALIGEMAEHPGQCLGPVIMGAPGNREAQHGFQNVDLLVPILGQLGYGVDQRVLDSFNLLLRLYGGSLRPSTLLDTVGEFPQEADQPEYG